ncbi:FeoB-associated Cys-rich membrane protein [Youxingia wuxianensis]|uniref:FeoB-associated Cys-rich membrane protein n=1 Tax=Youxingia wuxianensis TaxID=2763678 RepID=A0A926IHF3_9FIRM|nr:FeoB-associated Cys-rich membrane protein [Youxingia wuxianensis]MBC8585226.1 FeoB-associated Cys-rich membrane protein [Youxingia wuxianensis]
MATWIIGTIVIGAMIFAAYKSFKNHKDGGCGCGCSGCPHSQTCHKS